eukprot:TRINITY_DN18239_c0_g1_i1.p1 TRINITY_DN18239_c0_g1~~TRINITY_DN18239_c0_g1_i1.p1  ORF type:complete len:1306 (+),score=272.83 TRINITY_DN18239_c0_g1_i1:102-4019(+)
MKIRPSNLGTYFHRGGCEKYLLQSSEEQGVEAEKTPVGTEAEYLERGNKFEENVVKNLQERGITVIDATEMEAFVCGSGGLAEYLNSIAGEGEIYIAQLPLAATPVGTVGTDLSLSRAFPDLLRVQRTTTITVTVIDIKASLKMKVSHQAQIAAYKYILEKHLNGTSIAVSSVGEIWRAPQPHEDTPLPYIVETTDLAVMQSQVRRVLKMMQTKLTNPAWVLNPSTCTGCSYIDKCRDEAAGTLKALKNMTLEKLEAIQATTGVATLKDLDAWWTATVATDPSKEQLAMLLNCRTDDERIPQVKACLTTSVEPANFHKTPLKQSDTEAMLVAVFSPESNALQKFAVATAQDKVTVLTKPTMQQVVDALLKVLRGTTHDATLQFYTTSDQEIRHLSQQLVRWAVQHPDSVDLKECLLRIADHSSLSSLGLYSDLFQGLDSTLSIKESSLKGQYEEICYRLGISSSGTKGTLASRAAKHISGKELTADTPAQTVSQVAKPALNKLMYGPAKVASLDACLNATLHWPSVGITLSSDISKFTGIPIIDDLLPLGEAQVTDRAVNGYKLLEWLRKKHETTNLLKGENVRNTSPLMWNKSPVASQLLYSRQAEALAQAQNMQNTRPCIVLEKIQSGKSFRFCVVEGEQYVVYESFKMGGWLLSPSPPVPCTEGRINKAADFPDLTFSCVSALSKQWGDIEGITLCDIDRDEAPCRDTYLKKLFSKCGDHIGWLTVFKRGGCEEWLANAPTGKLFMLHERYTDVNFPKVMTALCAVDATLFVDLLEKGAACMPNKPVPASPGNLEELRKCMPMTASQERAFDHSLTSQMQLVWGPPGTGKTFYLARAIVRWMETALLSCKQCHILVSSVAKTAFTEVIERVKKLVAERAVLNPKWDEVLVCILDGDYWYDTAPPRDAKSFSQSWGRATSEPRLQDPPQDTQRDVQESSRSPSPDFREAPPKEVKKEVNFSVMGCTTWRLMAKSTFKQAPDAVKRDPREYKVPKAYDVVVIDEASQMPTTDSSTLINKVNRETGRLVLAGDHLQLGPIKRNKPAGKENTHGYCSVFRSLMEGNNGVLVKLTENLRSNRTICRFSQRLYDKDYNVPKGFGEKTLKEEKNVMETKVCERDLVELLSENKKWRDGMLTVMVDGGSEYDQAMEAELCHRIAKSIEMCSVGEYGGNYSTEVCTPTRLQRDALSHYRDNPFAKVDTINKMQGQTSDVMFVAYSIPSQKADFFYDLTRLNVAFTRARNLTVLVTCQAVFEPPFTICNDKQSQQGFSHLSAFVASSQVLQFTLEGKSLSGEWRSNLEYQDS